MDVVSYFLKANVLIAIFTVLYFILFRKETYFHLNRYFLLFGIVSALIIPVLKISMQTVESIPIPVNKFVIPEITYDSMGFIDSPEIVQQSTSMNLLVLLKTLYLVGVLILGARFLLFLVKLLTLIKKGTLCRIGSTFFVATNQRVQPFSFFNFVFFNTDTAEDRGFNTIVAHENVHVNQLHTVDLLFTEILMVLFWFNPFVFLLRNAVRANHEFLADAAVINRGTDKLEYLQTLAVQATSHQFGGFGSHFKSSTLKKRIVMITKKKSALRKSLKYLLVLPIAALLFFSFTTREITESVIEVLESQNTDKNPLKRGETISLPQGQNVSFSAGDSIIQMGDDKVIIAGNAEVESGKYKFYGGMFEFDYKTNSLRALGDACYMTDNKTKDKKPDASESETGMFILPIPSDHLKRVGSGYGYRVHPIHKVKQFHYGIDYVADKGAPIVSIAQGTVREIKTANREKTGYGNLVIIDHADGFSSLYGQMSEIKVKAGDKIKQGDVVGLVGSSGVSTGPHLHFEIMKDGKRVNPKDYINSDC